MIRAPIPALGKCAQWSEHEHRVRSCSAKDRYVMREHADAAASEQSALHSVRLYVYTCAYCIGYHLSKTAPSVYARTAHSAHANTLYYKK